MTEMPRWSTTTKRLVVAALIAAALVVIHLADRIVPPFVWAAILAFVLAPLVRALEVRAGWRRTYAAAAVYIALLALLVVVGRLLIPLIGVELGQIRRDAPTLVGNAETVINETLVGLGLQPLDVSLTFRDVGGSAARMVIPFVFGALSLLLEFLLFLIATFFLLRDGPRLGSWLGRQLPATYQSELAPLFRDVNALLGHYVRGQMILIVIMATVTTIGLTILNVPFSVLLGIVTGVLETIPIVGPITAGAIAVLVALGHPNPFGWGQLAYAAVVAVMYTVLRHLEDYVVIPAIIGRIVKLHPLIVIFSLLAGGAIFGLLGIFLAVPAAATMRLVLIYIRAKLRDEDALAEVQQDVL